MQSVARRSIPTFLPSIAQAALVVLVAVQASTIIWGLNQVQAPAHQVQVVVQVAQALQVVPASQAALVPPMCHQ